MVRNRAEGRQIRGRLRGSLRSIPYCESMRAANLCAFRARIESIEPFSPLHRARLLCDARRSLQRSPSGQPTSVLSSCDLCNLHLLKPSKINASRRSRSRSIRQGPLAPFPAMNSKYIGQFDRQTLNPYLAIRSGTFPLDFRPSFFLSSRMFRSRFMFAPRPLSAPLSSILKETQTSSDTAINVGWI